MNDFGGMFALICRKPGHVGIEDGKMDVCLSIAQFDFCEGMRMREGEIGIEDPGV